MIFITGDTHGSHDIKKLRWLKNESFTCDDYLIILGDAAIIWHGNEKDLEIQKWYAKNIPCTVLFIDGNHDNFAALNKLPIEDWNGGCVHRINNQIIHLMRGQVYNINGSNIELKGYHGGPKRCQVVLNIT